MTDCVKKCSVFLLGFDTDCFAECLPTCAPRDKREGYEILGRKQGVLGTFPIDTPIDLPGQVTSVYSPPTDADIEAVARSPLWLKGRGFEGLCKFPQRTAEGEISTAWCAAKKFAGIERLLIAGGLSAADVHNTLHSEEMVLTAQDVAELRKALDLKEYDIGCMPSVCPKEDTAGNFSTGKYRFSNKLPSLERWIGILEKGPIAGLDDSLRQKVLSYLRDAHTFNNKTFDFQEIMKTQNAIAVAAAVLLGVFVGYPFVKDIVAWYRGRVTFTDFEKVIQETLKLNPAFDIRGRDLEARAAWELADTHPEDGFRHIIFDAPTGEGKDEIVRKMMLIKVQGDPVVPEHFRKAPVKKISAAEFQAETKYRGTVADKVAEIGKDARKGPVIYYISEIDSDIMSGEVSTGSSEVVGKLLLDLLEDPVIRKNLLIIGTTSRGHEMVEKFPDLKRRFNWPHVRQFTLADVADLVAERITGKGYAERTGVTVPQEMSDAALRLSEVFYRPATANGTVMPRFDAAKQVVATAVRIAKKTGARELMLDHVIAAVEQRAGASLDRVAVDMVLKIEAINDIPLLQHMSRLLRQNPAFEGMPDVEIVDTGRSMLAEWRALPEMERSGQNVPGRTWVTERIDAIASGKLSGKVDVAAGKKDKARGKPGEDRDGTLEGAKRGGK